MNKIVPVEPVKATLLGARNDIESQVINAANQTEAPVLDSTMPKKQVSALEEIILELS